MFPDLVKETEIAKDMMLTDPSDILEELALAKAERAAGHKGRLLDDIISDMERIVAEAEAKRNGKRV